MKTHLLLLLALILPLFAVAQTATRVLDPDNPDPGSGWYYYENKGQIIDNAQNVRNDIKYYTTHSGVRMYLGADTISFAGHNWGMENDTLVSDTAFRLDMQFFCPLRDANQTCPNTIATYEPSPDSLNYYLAHCSSGIEGVPGYGGVVYQDAFPGTDVHFFSNPEGPISYFVFHPTADTSAFALLFNGHDSIQPVANYLHVYMGHHDIWFPDGIAYQVDNLGNVLPLTWTPTWYKANNNMVRMQFGSYNPAYDLVIRTGTIGQKTTASGTDNLIWTTYYGDSGSEANPDSTREWAVDGMPIIKTAFQNNKPVIWHAMTSRSHNFDLYSGNSVAKSGLIPFRGNHDCIVSSFDRDSSRRWATYFGGSGYEEVSAMMIVDADVDYNNRLGNLIVGGRSKSDTIPGLFYNNNLPWHKITNVPAGTNYFNTGSFLASFGASNGRLKYSTFFGGGSQCYIDGLAWDGSKHEIVFCGYISTNNWSGILDTTNQYPGGNTMSLRRGGRYFQTSNTDRSSGFIGSFDTSRNLKWCTLIGGDSMDVVNLVVPDKSGGLYALGNTKSRSNGITVSTSPLYGPANTNLTLPFVNPGGGAYFQTSIFRRRGFILHFNSNRAVDWGTLFGAGYDNEYLGMAVNSKNDLYISGMIREADTIHSNQADNSGNHRIPIYAAISGSYTQGYGDTTGGHNAGQDAIIARFDAPHRLRWSSLFGQAGREQGPIRVVIDSADHVYMAGSNEIVDMNWGAPAQGIPIYPVTPLLGRYRQELNASDRTLISPFLSNNRPESSDGWLVQFNPQNKIVWSTMYGGIFPGKHPISGGSLSASIGNYQDAREIITSIDAITYRGKVSLCMTGITKNPQTPMYFSNAARRRHQKPVYDDPLHAGNWDAFIGMFDDARSTSVPAVSQAGKHGNITIAPNPSHDRFTVTFNNESSANRMPMVVMNAFGQVLLSGDINVVRGVNKFMLDLGQLPAGIYFLQLASNGQTDGARMIKY